MNMDKRVMSRKERRWIKKHDAKNRPKRLYSYYKQFIEEIIHKIDIDLELDENENMNVDLLCDIYIYRKMPKSFIISKIKPAGYNLLKNKKDYFPNIFFEFLVDIYFEFIDPIIKEGGPLKEKIIAYWNERTYTEGYLEQLYNKMEKNFFGILDFKLFSKEYKKRLSIEYVEIDRKMLLEEQEKLINYGIDNIQCNKETIEEHNERLFSQPEFRATQLKNLLDKLPDIDTLLKDLEEYVHNPKSKDIIPTAAVKDMLAYMDNPNVLKNRLNYILVLKELMNSKHPTIEALLKIRESRISEYLEKHNKPIELDDSKIEPQLEQEKRVKYKRVAEKR